MDEMCITLKNHENSETRRIKLRLNFNYDDRYKYSVIYNLQGMVWANKF